MTPLLPLGLAIALHTTVLDEGFVCCGFRRSASRAAEYRGLFVLEPLPTADVKLKILVEDDDSRTSEIEPALDPILHEVCRRL